MKAKYTRRFVLEKTKKETLRTALERAACREAVAVGSLFLHFQMRSSRFVRSEPKGFSVNIASNSRNTRCAAETRGGGEGGGI